MRILITGAAGFIGYHLAKFLANDANNHIVGIDNINDYYDVKLKYARLNSAGMVESDIVDNALIQSITHPNYYFQKIDLRDLEGLEKLFKEQNFQIVINLAAQAGVRYSIKNPHSYVQSNIVGFVNILECCRYNSIRHLIYASSSSVYGMNEKVPFNEDDRVDYPVSLYAATKRSTELLAYTYSHLYNLPTTALRLFTVYGPWGRPDMAPMLFTQAITHNKPIKLFNNGNMERDFTYIDDIIQGIFTIIHKIPDKKNNPPYYRIFNIGNSKPVRLMDFISALENELGEKAVFEMAPMQAGDVLKTYADTAKLEKISGYKPQTDLKEGVHKFIRWYKSFYG